LFLTDACRFGDASQMMLDGLRMCLATSDAPLPGLHTSLQLLAAAPSLAPLARHHCVALVGAVLEALQGTAAAAALSDNKLLERVADMLLVFLAACSHAATEAAG
jgi:hypothetical protein